MITTITKEGVMEEANDLIEEDEGQLIATNIITITEHVHIWARNATHKLQDTRQFQLLTPNKEGQQIVAQTEVLGWN